MPPFTVVVFTATNTVGIISSSWFTTEEEEECFYPRVCDRAKLEKMIREASTPTESWKTYCIRSLGKAATYSRALEKAELAENTSHLDTDGDDSPPTRKRRFKPNRKYISSDKSDTDLSDLSEMEYNPPNPPLMSSARPSISNLHQRPHTQSSMSSPQQMPHAQSSMSSPQQMSHPQPPMSSPEQMPHTRPSMSSPRQMPHTQSSKSSPQQMPHPQPPMSSPQQMPHTRPSMSSPRQMPHTQPPMSSPRQMPHTQPSMSSPRQMSHTQPSMSSPRQMSHTQPSMSSPRQMSHTQPSMSSPQQMPHTQPLTSSPQQISSRPRPSTSSTLPLAMSCRSTLTSPPWLNVEEDTGSEKFKRVFTLLEDIRETQRVHGGMIASIVRSGRSETTFTMPEGASFPIKTLQEFYSMEIKLGDPSFATGVVHVLGDIGGNTLDEGTKRIMRFLLKNEVTLQFNLIGKNGKRAFSKTSLFEIVYRALKRNSRTSGCCKREVERAVGKWLAGGRDRGGNRTRRIINPTSASPMS